MNAVNIKTVGGCVTRLTVNVTAPEGVTTALTGFVRVQGVPQPAQVIEPGVLLLPAAEPGEYLYEVRAGGRVAAFGHLLVRQSAYPATGDTIDAQIDADLTQSGGIFAVTLTEGARGKEGKNAYELAKENGYEGTEAEWLGGVANIAAMENSATAAAAKAEAAATDATDSAALAAGSKAAAEVAATDAAAAANDAAAARGAAADSAAAAAADATRAAAAQGAAADSAAAAATDATRAAAAQGAAADSAAAAATDADRAADSAAAAAAAEQRVNATTATFEEIKERWNELGDLIPEREGSRPVGAVPDSRFAAWALERAGKVYISRVFSAAYNPAPKITDAQAAALSVERKLLDNAGREVTMATAAAAPTRDDYAAEFLFFWERCNYIRDNSGAPYITAVRGDADYKTEGTVDVGTFGPTFWYATAYDMRPDHLDADGKPMYQLWIISELPFDQLSEAYRAELESYGVTSLDVWPECVRGDGSIAPYWCHSAYYGGIASDGFLRSQPGLPLYCNVSPSGSTALLTKRGTGYRGNAATVTGFGMLFDIIKNATKNSQSIHSGATSYDVSYTPAVNTDAAANFFPLTSSQAGNIPLWSTVYVGTGNSRDYTGTGRNIVKAARVIAKNTATMTDSVTGADVSVVQVVLDIPGDKHFRVTKTAAEANAADRVAYYLISGQPMSGCSDRVVGKHDGQAVMDSKHAYRVQGTEFAVGTWLSQTEVCAIRDGSASVEINGETVELAAYDSVVYKRPRGVATSFTAATVKKTYKPLAVLRQTSASNGTVYIGDVMLFDGVPVPVLCGSKMAGGDASTSGHCDQLVPNGTSSGCFAWFTEGRLSYGAAAGSAYVIVNYASYGYWYSAPRD